MLKIKREGDPQEYVLRDDSLWVQGHASDHIWGMLEPGRIVEGQGFSAQLGPTEIGLRFDSGDSGALVLNKRQAHDVIDTLNDLLSQM